MKIVLPIFSLFFLCHFGAAAQCNYDLLVKEGRALFEKEQYRAALKKFNAARICDPSKSGEVDKEVDRVFDAIEAQRDIAKEERFKADQERLKTQNALNMAEEERKRFEIEKNRAVAALKLADEMRDSARTAKQSEKRILSFQESNELIRLGEAKFYENDYERAIYLYERANGLLKNLDQGDSLVSVKIEIVKEKVEQAKMKMGQFDAHKDLIAKGDVLAAAGWEGYTDAYTYYINAKNIGYDTAQCIARLDNLERLIDYTSISKEAKRSAAFQKLMITSANENKARGSNRLSELRLKDALENGFEEVESIVDLEQRIDAAKYVRRMHLVHKMELQVGFNMYFPYLNAYSFRNIPMLQMGFNFYLNRKLGAGFTYANGKKNFLSSELDIHYGKVEQSELGFYLFYDLFKKKNALRKQPIIQIQPKIGFTIGKSAHFDFLDNQGNWTYFTDSLNSLYKLNKDLYDADEILVEDFKYQSGSKIIKYHFKHAYDSYYLEANWEREKQPEIIFKNITLSTKVKITPFKNQGVSLYVEPTWNIQIAPKIQSETINPAAIIMEIYQSSNIGRTLSSSERQDIINKVGEEYFFTTWEKRFSSGFSLQFGLSYRF